MKCLILSTRTSIKFWKSGPFSAIHFDTTRCGIFRTLRLSRKIRARSRAMPPGRRRYWPSGWWKTIDIRLWMAGFWPTIRVWRSMPCTASRGCVRPLRRPGGARGVHRQRARHGQQHEADSTDAGRVRQKSPFPMCHRPGILAHTHGESPEETAGIYTHPSNFSTVFARELFWKGPEAKTVSDTTLYLSRRLFPNFRRAGRRHKE